MNHGAGALRGADHQVSSVSGRLSLRAPQRESLGILARVTELIPLEKGQDLVRSLATIQTEFLEVADFEREFPSLCFALATGVGKTRLMGAFIAYLHLARGLRHFFVLAPNLTIYNKLIADFTPGTPKYVFQGIGEFAQNPPELITGENYEGGRGVRGSRSDLFGERDVHINIFNISKLNSEVRGGNAPRIRRLSEYIGESYFEYLAGLDDLVLLMDEAHRYRASAGMRALNELRPVLGLELTATPQVESGRGIVPFQNVIYSYPLARALRDGFVKQPAVATRENFDASGYGEEALERVKLEDGVRVHESTKAELETYAREHGVRRVKPFVLVIARDTSHAGSLQALLESDEFFDGAYRGRVITVHSNIRGEEKDETVARLLAVEDPAEPTEIVIHVNMLKEGWDVTNLYTIVPLRAANARTLVEQSIGRGLRLPYGRRTGVKAVDRLTIVAHDRFQEIVDEANRPDSPLNVETVVIGRDIPDERQVSVVIRPVLEEELGLVGGGGEGGSAAEAELARTTLEVIHREFQYLPSSSALRVPAVRERLVAAVRAEARTAQGELGEEGKGPGVEGLFAGPDVEAVVDRVAERVEALTIDLPRIVVVPKGEVMVGYGKFELDTAGIRLQPVDEALVVHGLVDNVRERLHPGGAVAAEGRPEDYLVRYLVDYPDISYDETADLLYRLAGQMITHLAGYLPDAEAVENVLRHHGQTLARQIHAQLQEHRWESSSGQEARVTRGFERLRGIGCTTTAGQAARPFRQPVDDKLYIRGLRFAGFKKCLYPEQRFDSDAERRFAVLLEDTAEVLKWFKPGRGQLKIYHADDGGYEPDFVVETRTMKYLCETKRADQIEDAAVQAKARAAALWCEHASAHAREHGAKEWEYLLVPHDAVRAEVTWGAVVGAYRFRG
jgi:type III restriction enzyme